VQKDQKKDLLLVNFHLKYIYIDRKFLKNIVLNSFKMILYIFLAIQRENETCKNIVKHNYIRVCLFQNFY